VRLYGRQQAQHLVSKRVYLLREGTFVEGERAAQLRLRASANEIGDRLRLRQIQLAVQKCPQCKLAWLGRTRPFAPDQPQHTAQQVRTAVAVELYDILACIAARGAERQQQGAIERLVRCGVYNRAEVGAVALKRFTPLSPKQPLSDGERLPTR
jgi:hypothetical protein